MNFAVAAGCHSSRAAPFLPDTPAATYYTTTRQRLHLSTAKRCADKAGHLNGLADDNFSNPRYFASSAFGICTRLPPQPHNNYLGPGPGEIVVDKSTQHPGRLYIEQYRPDWKSRRDFRPTKWL